MSRGKCTPEQIAECPLRRHFSDTHHLWYPRADYRTKVEKEFRELPENKVQLCRNEHQEIHFNEPDPIKPSREYMVAAIAGLVVAGEADVT